MIGTDSYRIVIEISSPPDNFDYRHSALSVTAIDKTMDHTEPLKATLLGNGVIRLFRDFEEEEKNTIASAGDDTMVLIIALPTYFTATDLLGFVGDHYMEYVTHIRILKLDKANRFLVLIKFSDLVKAQEFQYHYDGRPFNSMEPETCHVVFVKSIVTEGGDMENRDVLIPFLLDDPFTSRNVSVENSVENSPNCSLVNSGSFDETTQIELPTCPVCLERLDYEISGLLTIPCQHTFHCLCLSKWKDDTCPVCRYTNNISNHKIRRSVRRLTLINNTLHLQQEEQPHSQEHCMQCDSDENLWVCLICGNVGCSRYAPEQHSLKHFVETGHCFAMELNTSRVWDYAGDNYVHRLIASEADGKIVELPEKHSGSTEKATSKDAGNAEYSELLLSQLVSQREYYELLLNENGQNQGMRLRRGSTINSGSEFNTVNKRLVELELQLDDVLGKYDKFNTTVVPALQKKVDMMKTSQRLALNELQEASVLNEGLSRKIDHLTEENQKLKAENTDLADQVKDLMFFLESREKFKDQPDDVKEGTIMIQEKKKKKKKKH